MSQRSLKLPRWFSGPTLSVFGNYIPMPTSYRLDTASAKRLYDERDTTPSEITLLMSASHLLIDLAFLSSVTDDDADFVPYICKCLSDTLCNLNHVEFTGRVDGSMVYMTHLKTLLGSLGMLEEDNSTVGCGKNWVLSSLRIFDCESNLLKSLFATKVKCVSMTLCLPPTWTAPGITCTTLWCEGKTDVYPDSFKWANIENLVICPIGFGACRTQRIGLTQYEKVRRMISFCKPKMLILSPSCVSKFPKDVWDDFKNLTVLDVFGNKLPVPHAKSDIYLRSLCSGGGYVPSQIREYYHRHSRGEPREKLSTKLGRTLPLLTGMGLSRMSLLNGIHDKLQSLQWFSLDLSSGCSDGSGGLEYKPQPLTDIQSVAKDAKLVKKSVENAFKHFWKRNSSSLVSLEWLYGSITQYDITVVGRLALSSMGMMTRLKTLTMQAPGSDIESVLLKCDASMMTNVKLWFTDYQNTKNTLATLAATLQNITSLELCNVGVEDIPPLASFPHLKSLNLYVNNPAASDSDIRVLCEQIRTSRIVDLHSNMDEVNKLQLPAVVLRFVYCPMYNKEHDSKIKNYLKMVRPQLQ